MAINSTPQQRHDRTIGHLEAGKFGRFYRDERFLIHPLTDRQADRLAAYEWAIQKYGSRAIQSARRGRIDWDDIGVIAQTFCESEIDLYVAYYENRARVTPAQTASYSCVYAYSD